MNFLIFLHKGPFLDEGWPKFTYIGLSGYFQGLYISQMGSHFSISRILISRMAAGDHIFLIYL